MRRRLMGGSSAITATIISQPDTVAGDVCFYDSATDSKVFYRLDEGTDIIPETCTPIGVVVIPASHDVYGTGECAVMSLRLMSTKDPKNGTTSVTSCVYYGQTDTPTPLPKYPNFPVTKYDGTVVNGSYAYLPQDFNDYNNDGIIDFSYWDSPKIESPYDPDFNRNLAYYQTSVNPDNAFSDFNGIENTNMLIKLHTYENIYTVSSITNGIGAKFAPAAVCCHLYQPFGTNQGDWYLPALGELGYICPFYRKNIKNVLKTLNDTYGKDTCHIPDGASYPNFVASTAATDDSVFHIDMYESHVELKEKDTFPEPIAFLRVPPPPTPAGITVTFDDNDSGALLTSDGGDNSWIKGRRCLAKPQSDGSVSICYLDENNSELYHDGTTAADLSGAQGQWMTDIPEYWFHMDESTEGIHKLSISPTEVEGWKHSRRVLVGVTEAVNVDGKLWSRKVSGGEQSTGNLTSVVFHNYANAIGNGWDIIDYETHCKIGHLFYAKYLNKDCQTVIGIGENSYTRTIGTTSSLGNNDGTTDTQISFLGIEDAWGDKYEWIGGIHRNYDTVYIYDGFQPDSVPTVDYRTETIPYYARYACITKMQWGDNADMLPIACVVDSNYSQGYFDYGGVDDFLNWRVATRSGSRNHSYGGVACLHFGNISYSGNTDHGSRIQYRGTINEVSDIATFESLSIV